MAEITIDESKLKDLIDEAVQERLKLTLEDMEEVRKSPAVAIIRLEGKVDSIQQNMVTKAEFREEMSKLDTRIGKLETMQKLLIALYFSIFAMLGAMMAKLFLSP